MHSTPICELLSIRYPILQGGMAHIATTELVSAVSNAGGLGILGADSYEPEWIQQQIRSTRLNTDKPFGINLTLGSPYLSDTVRIVQEEKVAVVTTSDGNPADLIPRLKESGILVIPVISSVRQAVKMEQCGADAVIAEGMESGGHIGATALMALLPQVTKVMHIPVIAAGGIATGKGLVAALAMGAQAVQMGTRFVCSSECIAAGASKNCIVAADDRATLVTGASIKRPLRTLHNEITKLFSMLESSGATEEELVLLMKGKVYEGLVSGDTENGFIPAGQISGLIDDIKPVKEIIETIMAEAEATIRNLEDMIKGSTGNE